MCDDSTEDQRHRGELHQLADPVLSQMSRKGDYVPLREEASCYDAFECEPDEDVHDTSEVATDIIDEWSMQSRFYGVKK